MKKSELFVNCISSGAFTLTSALLGFSIEEPLTKSQAEEFHKFVFPLIIRHWNRVKGDEIKEKEFEELYQTSTPSELLQFLLIEEAIIISPDDAALKMFSDYRSLR